MFCHTESTNLQAVLVERAPPPAFHRRPSTTELVCSDREHPGFFISTLVEIVSCK